MGTIEIIFSLIMGGFIWFFVAVVLEEPVLNRIREKKYGKGSSQNLSKEEKQSFYIPLAFVSALLGLLIGYLGSQGKL